MINWFRGLWAIVRLLFDPEMVLAFKEIRKLSHSIAELRKEQYETKTFVRECWEMLRKPVRSLG